MADGFKRNELVVLTTLGYKDRFAYIDGQSNSDKDGTFRYKVRLRGMFQYLTFRVDEMRHATPQEQNIALQYPSARHV